MARSRFALLALRTAQGALLAPAPARGCAAATFERVARSARPPTGRGRGGGAWPKDAGFTLIELIVVMAIVALLATIALPRYFAHVERSKEVALRQSLNVMRDAIDKFSADQGRYPDALDELVTRRYIRSLPVDPITESATTWVTVAPPGDSTVKGSVYDVRSGATGKAADGTPFAEW